MHLSVISGTATQQDTPLLVLAAFEGEALPEAAAGLLEEGDFAGKPKQTLLLYPRGAMPARRLLLLGLGKRDAFGGERLREAAATAMQRAADLRVDRVTFALPPAEVLPPAEAAQALAEGALLGSYRFQQYKTGLTPEETKQVAELQIVADDADAARQGVSVGGAVARGVALARDLGNTPGNDLTPAKLVEAARAVAERFGMAATILGPEELRAQGFGGVLGVGQGSANPPHVAVVEYGAGRAGVPTICLVGKGITFDTGGISIKPAEGMENMKMDMGGAAAVIGTLQVLGELQLPLHVVGLIGAAENMPSATAYKPGDILKTLGGKTIEVINTDAEGRVVLADVLHYAQRYRPDAIIDLATLTGAIMVALGPHAVGLMSNDDALAQRLLRAGEASGERAWQLPLWEPYKEMVKSDVADVKNSAGRHGGAITAAAFLSNFVGEYPWAHLDIAGTAWTDAKPRPYTPKGATGVGVRLLTQALRTWAEGR
ncbi:MAG TPA: leucyl aminopeptidase [Roseiflexaceae bacterium]|nr:leucyl aminopeptidase [Roseiflexaceae bacterium]